MPEMALHDPATDIAENQPKQRRFARLLRWLRRTAEDAGDAKPKAEKPPKKTFEATESGALAGLSMQILHLFLHAGVIIVLGLLIYTSFQVYNQRNAIILQPIGVPDALSAEGFTSDLVTQNLGDRIAYLQNVANTKSLKTKQIDDDQIQWNQNTKEKSSQASQTDWNKDVQAIQIPETGLSIRDIADFLRTLIPALQPDEITGEFFVSDNKLNLQLWLNGANVYSATAPASGIDSAAVNSLIDGIAVDQINPSTQDWQLGGAFSILEETEPYVSASAMDSWNAEVNSRKILTDIISNAEPDDPVLPWTHNLLGFMNLKISDYKDAIAQFKMAPKLAVAHSNLCYIYQDFRQNFYAIWAAVRECKRAISLDHKLLKPRELLGNIYILLADSGQTPADNIASQHDFVKALKQFHAIEGQIIDERSPRLYDQTDLAKAYVGLGTIFADRFFRQYNPNLAQAEYQDANGLNLGNPTAYTLLGDLYGAQREWSQAAAQYQAALELAEYPDPRIGLGNIDIAQQNWTDALNQYGKANIPAFSNLQTVLQNLAALPKDSQQIPALLETACRLLSQSKAAAIDDRTLTNEINAGLASLAMAGGSLNCSTISLKRDGV